MTEHSPGPWRLNPEMHGPDGWEQVVDANGDYVADVPNDAAARLIAAAPELLEALNEAAVKLTYDPVTRDRLGTRIHDLIRRIEGEEA